MAAQPLGDASQHRQLWDDTLRRLSTLSNTTLQTATFWQKRARELELELSYSQHALHASHEIADREVRAHKQLVATLNQQMFGRDSSLTSLLIHCVINGDEMVFDGFANGRAGGQLAAEMLTRRIADYLRDEGLEQLKPPVSFWITVYFNKGELVRKFVLNNICTAEQFDSFLAGFSERSPRFSLVDVGDIGASGTNDKIKAYIETVIHFPQTMRLFLAGVRGPQYTSLLDMLETEKVIGKVVLVGVDEADRPPIDVAFLGVGDGLFVRHPRPTPLDFRRVNTHGGLISPQSPASRAGGRPIDPSLPLHKQDPPPCNEYYLMACSKEPAQCKYSHDYILTPEQMAELAANAKKAPCNWLKSNRRCPFGDQCCWGHVCPSGPKCFHLSKGKCWFKGESMHPPEPPPSHNA